MEKEMTDRDKYRKGGELMAKKATKSAKKSKGGKKCQVGSLKTNLIKKGRT